MVWEKVIDLFEHPLQQDLICLLIFFNVTGGSMTYRGQLWAGEGLLQDGKRVGVFKTAL